MNEPITPGLSDPWNLFRTALKAGVTISPAMPVKTHWITPKMLNDISATALRIIEQHGTDFWNEEVRRTVFPDIDERAPTEALAAGMEEGQVRFMLSHILYALGIYLEDVHKEESILRNNAPGLCIRYKDEIVNIYLESYLERSSGAPITDDWRDELVSRMNRQRILELHPTTAATLPIEDLRALWWFVANGKYTAQLYFRTGMWSTKDAITWAHAAIKSGKNVNEAVAETTRLGWWIMKLRRKLTVSTQS